MELRLDFGDVYFDATNSLKGLSDFERESRGLGSGHVVFFFWRGGEEGEVLIWGSSKFLLEIKKMICFKKSFISFGFGNQYKHSNDTITLCYKRMSFAPV